MKVRFAPVTIEFSGSKPAKAAQLALRHGPVARARRGAKLATAIVYPYVAEAVRVPASPSSWPFAVATPLASPKPEKASPPPQPEGPALVESIPAASEATKPSEVPPDPLPVPPAVEAEPLADLQPAAPDTAAEVSAQPEPCSEERTSRARIVERLWDDPIREELEVNLGATTESNLYVDVDLQVANGGVLVATYQDLPLGTQVSLHITLAGGLATSAHGRVTLKRESLEAFGDPSPGVCVAFELLSNEALALLEQFAAIRTPWLIEDE